MAARLKGLGEGIRLFELNSVAFCFGAGESILRVACIIPEWHVRRPNRLRTLTAKIQEYVGADVETRIELVDHIPLTMEGKRRLFLTNCPTGVQVLNHSEDSGSATGS